MALKWWNIMKPLSRLIDDLDGVLDTGWRGTSVNRTGNWLAYHRTWAYAPVDFKTETEAKAFVESTYVLEISNGT